MSEQIWNNFCEAATCSFQTEYFGQQYPEYAEKLNRIGFRTMLKEHIVYALKHGMNPTQCIEDLLKCGLDGSRYSFECIDGFITGFRMLIDAGGVFPYQKLLDANYDQVCEEEFADYQVRGALLDAFRPHHAIAYADWKNIPATYWEDIEGNNPEDRLMYLKYTSNFLQSIL